MRTITQALAPYQATTSLEPGMRCIRPEALHYAVLSAADSHSQQGDEQAIHRFTSTLEDMREIWIGDHVLD